jgi:sugar/nucleoside kinase (ribokinase family)
LYVSHFPAANAKARILRRERSLGGLTAIALVAAARLGARAAFAGRLGSDAHSLFVESELQRFGVMTNDVVRLATARPGHSTILVDEAAGTRAVLSEALGERGADELLPAAELVRASRVLFVDGHGVPGSIRAARIARAAGCSVVADFERAHTGEFDTLLELVDHLVVPEDFALSRSGCSDPASAAAALSNSQRAAVVVTCGHRGGFYCEAHRSPRHYSAFSVEVRDTTGCGDVFHGVYAAGLALGWDLATRIRYASAAAALKAARGGGADAIPDRDCVEDFLRTTNTSAT